jgi:hypothetical protein
MITRSRRYFISSFGATGIRLVAANEEVQERGEVMLISLRRLLEDAYD